MCAARIQAYEMAYRLQSSAPELLNLACESRAMLARYGLTDVHGKLVPGILA